MNLRFTITCNDEEHTIEVDESGTGKLYREPSTPGPRLVLHDHDPEAEEIAMQLGSEQCRCMEVWEEWHKGDERRGYFAERCEWLPGDGRYALGRHAWADLRGRVAVQADGLTPEQRFRLLLSSTESWYGEGAVKCPDLTRDQRFELAMKSYYFWRKSIARETPDLTDEQRQKIIDTVKDLETGDEVVASNVDKKVGSVL